MNGELEGEEGGKHREEGGKVCCIEHKQSHHDQAKHRHKNDGGFGTHCLPHVDGKARYGIDQQEQPHIGDEGRAPRTHGNKFRQWGSLEEAKIGCHHTVGCIDANEEEVRQIDHPDAQHQAREGTHHVAQTRAAHVVTGNEQQHYPPERIRTERGGEADDETEQQVLDDGNTTLPQAHLERKEGEQGKLLHDAPYAFVAAAQGDEIALGKTQRRGEQRPTDGKGFHAGASIESEPRHDVPDACREHSCGDPCAPQRLGRGLAQQQEGNNKRRAHQDEHGRHVAVLGQGGVHDRVSYITRITMNLSRIIFAR